MTSRIHSNKSLPRPASVRGYRRIRFWRGVYDLWAPVFDPALSIANFLLGYDDPSERENLVSLLGLRPGDSVLEVGAGTGRNLSFLQALTRNQHGGQAGGHNPESRAPLVVAQDLSGGMLRRLSCACRVQSMAEALPFSANSFDAVLHYGALNVFGDPGAALAEMLRVVRPGGWVVASDQGMREENRHGWRFRVARGFIPFFARRPPLDLVPAEAEDVELHWLWRGDCFAIRFRKPVE